MHFVSLSVRVHNEPTLSFDLLLSVISKRNQGGEKAEYNGCKLEQTYSNPTTKSLWTLLEQAALQAILLAIWKMECIFIE